jgi:predicted NBD/HSP70 family sugar kinase
MIQDAERAVLERLMWRGPQTRRSLALASELSRQSLSRLLFELEKRRIVESVKGHESFGGRKPAVVRINPELGFFIAVNFADTNSTVALADTSFRFQAMESISLPLRDGPAKILGEVTKWTKRTLTRKAHLFGIAVSVPGPVDKRTGLLVHPPALSGWEGFSFPDFFRQTFDVPILVDNDANMMALGELWMSRQAAEYAWNECWVVVKLSANGIGAGIISEGRLYSGAAGGAGEIGHIQVVPDGLRCRCGLRGCLETVAAAPAILEQAQKTVADRRRHTKTPQKHSPKTLREFARKALAGEEIANSLIQTAGTHIGEVLGMLVNVLNPTRILIGGDFASVGPTMLASIRQGVFARALPLMSRQLVVEPCRGSNSEILGCLASMFLRLFCDRDPASSVSRLFVQHSPGPNPDPPVWVGSEG